MHSITMEVARSKLRLGGDCLRAFRGAISAVLRRARVRGDIKILSGLLVLDGRGARPGTGSGRELQSA
jgi:hypothetical protein